jgi:hypothetical protein
MKKELEEIWLDKKCRSPLGPVWWTFADLNFAHREAPGLYYTSTKLEDEDVQDR